LKEYLKEFLNYPGTRFYPVLASEMNVFVLNGNTSLVDKEF